MNRRSDDDRPPRPEDDEDLMARDYDFEDALEKEWRETYGGRVRRSAPRGGDDVAGPLDPAA